MKRLKFSALARPILVAVTMLTGLYLLFSCQFKEKGCSSGKFQVFGSRY